MLLERIREKLPELTAGQAKIARFLLQNTKDAAFITASQVGQKVGVSESTVVRLAASLGYPGYPEMRNALQEVLMERLTTMDRLRKYGDAGESSDLCLQALNDDLRTLSQTISEFHSQDIERLSGAILKADHIYIVGHLSSRALAYFLWYYLLWFFPNTHLIDMTISSEAFVNATKDSLAIGISFPRYTRWTVETLKYAKKQGVRTASITSDYSGPMAEWSDIVVTVPWNPLSFIDSFTVPISVINCIILNTAQALGGEVHDKLEKLEKMWLENSVYAD